MDITQETERAWQVYHAHVALKGYDSPIARALCRMLVSFESATENGMREALTLSLSAQDFDWLCECIVINADQVRIGATEILPGVRILPECPPYSYFWGHDQGGRLRHYAVMEDDEFVRAFVATHEEIVSEIVAAVFRKAG